MLERQFAHAEHGCSRRWRQGGQGCVFFMNRPCFPRGGNAVLCELV